MNYPKGTLTTDPEYPLGQIIRDVGGVSLRFERRLAHSPERVWRALTESDQLRHWMPCDIVGPREAGAEVVVPFWEDELLTYQLEPTEDGTKLTVVVRLGASSPGADKVAAGHHVCLDQLIALVETDNPPRFIDADAGPYEALYS